MLQENTKPRKSVHSNIESRIGSKRGMNTEFDDFEKDDANIKSNQHLQMKSN